MELMNQNTFENTGVMGVQAKKVLSTVEQTTCYLNELVAEHDKWFENAYRTSNEQLYAMLLKCYALYNSMCDRDETSKEMRKAVNAFAEAKGYRFKQSTHTITKIVKCVFGVDRRRVSTYSLVLRAALKLGVKNSELVEFIRMSGGVEEIRLSQSAGGLTSKEKAQIASRTLELKNIGTVKSQELAEMLDAGKIGQNKIFIGAWQADGSVVLRAQVDSESALTAALAGYYAKVQKLAVEKVQEVAQEELEAQKAAAKEAMLNVAALLA